MPHVRRVASALAGLSVVALTACQPVLQPVTATIAARRTRSTTTTTTIPTTTSTIAVSSGGGGGGGGSTSPTTTSSTTTSTTSTTLAPPTTTTTVRATGTRVAWLWPFSSDSPWNLPVGDGAQFALPTDPRVLSLLDVTATPWVNAGQYSHPIVQATDADPVATVSRAGFPNEYYRIPAGATPAAGYDHHLHVVQPNGRWLDEGWLMSGSGSSWTTGYHVLTDLWSTGMGAGGVRAYGGSAAGGLIRRWELDAGTIRHALALAVTANELKPGFVWPATAQDGDAATSYHGQLPMGSYVAIPSSVNVEALGLRPGALLVARALQTYGAYVVDRSGAFTLYADPSLETDSRLADMRSDLARIRPLLSVVTDNGPGSVNGGGTRLAPLAPPLG